MIPIRTKDGAPSPRRDKQAVKEASSSRVVQRPVPESQVKNARTYQIDQINRRFKPKETTLASGDTSLIFNISPSDPDFPFELESLKCELRVPAEYPQRKPSIVVKNNDIPRGFAINIEKGFEKLVETRKGATLLALINALDRNLESFLSEQKAETVKLVTFKDTRHLEQEATRTGPQITTTAATERVPSPAVSQKPHRPYIPEESFTRDQIAEAKARRAQEVRQLEARMSRLPNYQRSSDGIVYTLPLEPKRRTLLPLGLQQVQSAQLIIPLLYPLQPLRVLLNGVDSHDAEGVEELFTKLAFEKKEMSLTSHLNYLTQNLHSLAKQAAAATATEATQAANLAAQSEAKKAEHSSVVPDARDGKGPLQVIPRPPEWTSAAQGSHSSDSEDYSDESEQEGDEEGSDSSYVKVGSSSSGKTQEVGTAMTFPSIELHNVELLEVLSLSLVVKCDRCRTLNEVTGLRDGVEKTNLSCKKCATEFRVKFRKELVHIASTRAGFIDVTGCTVQDMLPSIFIPTCGKCSTSFPATPGLSSVRGETTTNVCRECHSRFTFKIPQVKFLVYSYAASLPRAQGVRANRQEKLGLHAGEQLPDKGACEHYKRSYRWFRFSCCGKVFPCDKCHNASEESGSHIDEWASRMICGWCSREQKYHPEMCQFCGRSVIGKSGKGYWEGGKGTRNKLLMRRGDKRKYKRVGGGESRKEK
ncbi:hypothetical protein QBC37DRAFT_76688 [Rhypophila decipiens]|uniref:CHY-type domain-containing protein n=1 Tax=Rhypophila decipiens TaxID=261697 RepID=A0AAN6YKE0_9PEZI|nr:hypothetical protein QBC37DRAFT_76688 [Rhypophila decipiens]